MNRPTRHLALPLLSLALMGACTHHVEGDGAAAGLDGDLDAALVRGIGGLSFVSITHGRSYENGVLLAVQAPAAATRVEYVADGEAAGSSTNADDGFSVVVTVPVLGYTVVAARALDASGRVIGEVQAGILIEDRVVFGFTSPEREGGSYANGVWFKTQGPGEIVRVRYSADGWVLGESTDIPGEFPVRYTFSATGRRTVRAEGFDIQGNLVSEAVRTLIVAGDGSTSSGGGAASGAGSAVTSVPYFYQYANALAPGASCQNTSIAMVLAAFGWSGRPDDITAEFGRSTAQTPAGLESVFNTLAQRAGISARIDANTSGTIAGLRALVTSGKPAIIHGYFTSYGHVLVVTGFDGTHYTVNDPAGTWNRAFMGGYPNGWEPTAGRGIRYPKAAFELAVASYNGSSIADGSLWYHELR